MYEGSASNGVCLGSFIISIRLIWHFAHSFPVCHDEHALLPMVSGFVVVRCAPFNRPPICFSEWSREYHILGAYALAASAESSDIAVWYISEWLGCDTNLGRPIGYYLRLRHRWCWASWNNHGWSTNRSWKKRTLVRAWRPEYWRDRRERHPTVG